MVSNVRELFRRGARDETFGAEMGVVSMPVRLDGLLKGADPIGHGGASSRPSMSLRKTWMPGTRPGDDDASRKETLRAITHQFGQSGLFAGGREQVSAAPDGADHRGLARVRFDLAPDSHDPQIDRAIEGLAVARIGQFQQALA